MTVAVAVDVGSPNDVQKVESSRQSRIQGGCKFPRAIPFIGRRSAPRNQCEK